MLRDMQVRAASPVFVGRGPQRAVLAGTLRGADEGRLGAVLVGGEAGVGKTRLLEEFLAQAQQSGALTALGSCVEAGADGLPFAPVATVLRALHRQLGDEVTRAAAGFGSELARLLPELGAGAPRQAHDEEARGRLLEMTARLFEALAAERTVVVAVEDLHWSDRSTRELLGYAVCTVRHCRLLLVVTYRSDDIHRRHPLRPFLAEADRLSAVRRLELPRFTREEVRDQLAGILGADPAPGLVDQIYRRSDGNAFFVEELASAADGGTPGAISESVRDLLMLRVEALPQQAQRVVRCAAEGGSRVEHGLLRAVTGLSDDELLGALRAAVAARVLLAADDGCYRFRHSLVREAVDDDLLPGERTRLSRRYAEALQHDPRLVPAEELSARLSSYWYHARDASRALPAVLGAAADARSRHAYAEQLHLLQRALELWDEAPPEVIAGLRPGQDAESYPLCDCDDARLRCLDVLAEMTLAAKLAGEPERGLSVVNRALRSLQDMGHPVRAAWFWVQKSRLVRHLARGNGWQELARAQELLSGFPDSPVHARVLTEAAGWGCVFAPGPGSLATAERAVKLAQAMDDLDSELQARVSLAGLLADTGHGDAAAAGLRRVAERAAAEEMAGAIARSHVSWPCVLEAIGRSEEALAAAGRACGPPTASGCATRAPSSTATTASRCSRWGGGTRRKRPGDTPGSSPRPPSPGPWPPSSWRGSRSPGATCPARRRTSPLCARSTASTATPCSTPTLPPTANWPTRS